MRATNDDGSRTCVGESASASASTPLMAIAQGMFVARVARAITLELRLPQGLQARRSSGSGSHRLETDCEEDVMKP